jgi:hypothetical protein
MHPRKGIHLSQEFSEFAIGVEPLQLRTHSSALGRGGGEESLLMNHEILLKSCIIQPFLDKLLFVQEIIDFYS